MGANSPGFQDRVLAVIAGHVDDIPQSDVSQQMSSNGRFLSVTVTVQATSRAHLDDIYRALTGMEEILVVL